MGGSTYYIVGDGDEPGDVGPFTLTLTLFACGDGVLSKNEECDDGNPADGDGCSAACVVECNAAPGATDAFKRAADNHCYQRFNSNETWLDARAVCQGLGPGYDLAAISSAGERDYVDGAYANGDLWIGGHDPAANGKWKWTNGEPWMYEPWSGGGPSGDGDCVELDELNNLDNDEFNDLDCTTSQGYLCELEPAGT